jgi:hypothetical protein
MRTSEIAFRLEHLAEEGDFDLARRAYTTLGSEVGKFQQALAEASITVEAQGLLS